MYNLGLTNPCLAHKEKGGHSLETELEQSLGVLLHTQVNVCGCQYQDLGGGGGRVPGAGGFP